MMSPNDQRELIQLADLNLAAMIRHRMKMAPNGLLQEQDGVLLFTIGCPAANGHLNGVLRVNDETDAVKILDRARRFFQPLKRDFMVWVRDERDDDLEQALRDAGFTVDREPGIPCMALQRRLDQVSPSADIELRSVVSAEDVADYAQVMVAAFGMTNEVARAVFGETESLVAPQVAAFIVHHNNVPVAAAMTLIAAKVAGIYFVGTVPEARGRGLGEPATRAATNAGFDLGAGAAILQASVAGEPLYRRMGYQLLTRYRWYRSTMH
ncbi:MAG: GNAT family N-acetyltransferase [Pyrinomonadaceae bacterium]|nr:GNAT family N-acetyltransferase [Pyrinomonadaceae bacterium]